MKALVTGATGKVGNAVARQLAARGELVTALVRDPERAREALPEGVALAPGDVSDPESLDRAAAGAEAVFNCMGIFEQWTSDDGIFDRINAQGTRNVVAAARVAGVRRVVHTSTFDVFHAETGGTVSEAAVADYPKATAYERSKQRAEELALAESGDDMEVVICNPAGVYGPGPWASSGLDSTIRDAVRGRLPALVPGGITLVHVDDVAAGHLAAFDDGRPGERYILADGYATLREIVGAVVDAADSGRVPPTLPTPLARGLSRGGELVARLIRRPPLLPAGQLYFLLWQARADNAKARTELGVEFRPWQEGLAQTVAWMRGSGRL